MTLTTERPLILGSASPRRRALLGDLGIPLRTMTADIDESVRPSETVHAYLGRIVLDKLHGIASKLDDRPWGALLVADTTVVLDGCIVGKPGDLAEARQMVAGLAGRAHHVYTRYAIARPPDAARATVARTVRSSVTMRAASRDEIARYAATGEGLDKAGGYAVQGIGAFLVQSIEGSYSNVIGLPVCEVIEDLLAEGIVDAFP